MATFDLGAPLDGIEWMPGMEKITYTETTMRVICGADHRLERKPALAGYWVKQAAGGLRVLIGDRAMSPRLMAADSRERSMERRERGGRLAGDWLGNVAIPLEHGPGDPVVLTRALRNALAAPGLDERWSGWLRNIERPTWATRLPASCGRHTTALYLADVFEADAQRASVVKTKVVDFVT